MMQLSDQDIWRKATVRGRPVKVTREAALKIVPEPSLTK
jgi:hypothetical protein